MGVKGIRVRDDGTVSLGSDQQSVLYQRIATSIDWARHMQQLEDADKAKFDTRSERNLALVGREYWSKVSPDKDVLSINHLCTALKVKHTLVCGGHTAFVAKARSAEFEGIAEVAKDVLNDVWDSLDFDEPLSAAQWDSMIHPVGGVVEIGWRYRDRNFDREGVRPDELEIAEAELDGADAVPMMTPDGQTIGVPVEEFDDADKAVLALNMAEEAAVGPDVDDPFIERFNPRDFFVDPACTSMTLADARYAFRRKWVLVSVVKANKRFRNTKDIKGTAFGFYPRSADLPEPPSNAKDDIMRVDIFDGYCFFDFDKDGRDELYHIVFCPEVSKELLCESAPYTYFTGDNRFPFEVMSPWVTDHDRYDQEPDAELARDVQVGHDLAWTQLEWARAHSPNVLVVPTGTFSGDEGERTKRRIESGKENSVLELDPAFLQWVKWLDRPAIHTDAYQTLETAPNRIMDIIGVSDFQSNMTPDKQMTATEAGQIATQGGTRQDGEIERFYAFLERVAYKVLVLMQQFTERQRGYGYTSPSGDASFGQVNMADLRGMKPGSDTADNPLGDLEEPGIQFTISLDASKKRATNEYQERKDVAELLTALTAYKDMPDPRLPNRPLINLPILMRGLINTYDVPGQSEIIPPDPTEQEIMAFQQQQEAQMQAQAAQEAASADRDSQNAEADRNTKLTIAQMHAQRGQQ